MVTLITVNDNSVWSVQLCSVNHAQHSCFLIKIDPTVIKVHSQHSLMHRGYHTSPPLLSLTYPIFSYLSKSLLLCITRFPSSSLFPACISHSKACQQKWGNGFEKSGKCILRILLLSSSCLWLKSLHLKIDTPF